MTAPDDVAKVDVIRSASVGAPGETFECLPPGASAPLPCA
jgi:hypothetical protein